MFQEKPADIETEGSTPAELPRVAREPEKGPDPLIEAHGDLIFDLAASILSDPAQAQFGFRAIIKKLRKKSRKSYERYERAWVLKVTMDHLRAVSRRSPGIRKESAPEISGGPPEQRLDRIQTLLSRLSFDDHTLVLLRDKHGISYEDIASAMDTPVASLKLRREQVLRTLEGWIWESR